MGCLSSKTLLSVSFDDEKQFSFRGLYVPAKVVYVYDGDTLYFQFFYQKKLTQLCSRMLGYDSPEMIPKKNVLFREEEIRKAILARNRMIQLVSGIKLDDRKYSKDEIKTLLATGRKLVMVRLGEFDKYGRILATLYDKDFNLNQLMIQEGHGYEYHGGSK